MDCIQDELQTENQSTPLSNSEALDLEQTNEPDNGGKVVVKTGGLIENL